MNSKHTERLTNDLLQTAALLAIDDPLVGNRWIADLYFELSDRMRELLHARASDGEPTNATFATFAAWSAESLAVDVAPPGTDRTPELGRGSMAGIEMAQAATDARAVRESAEADDFTFTVSVARARDAGRSVDRVAEELGLKEGFSAASQATKELDATLKELVAALLVGPAGALGATRNDKEEDANEAAEAVGMAAIVLSNDLEETGVGIRRRRDALRARGGPLWWFYRRLAAGLSDDDSIATNIAAGQGEIVVEIGQAMSLFLTLFGRESRRNAAGWQQFTDGVVEQSLQRASFTATRSETAVGEGHDAFGEPEVTTLLDGFRPYFELLLLDDRPVGPASAKQRAEHIMLANLRLVAYEQRRLQPVLERNLRYLRDAAVRRAASRLSRMPIGLARRVVGEIDHLEEFGDAAVTASEILATRYAFNMIIGTETLAFGRDLPLPPLANPLRAGDDNIHDSSYIRGQFFPTALTNLEHPDLRALWQVHNRGRGSRSANQGSQLAPLPRADELHREPLHLPYTGARPLPATAKPLRRREHADFERPTDPHCGKGPRRCGRPHGRGGGHHLPRRRSGRSPVHRRGPPSAGSGWEGPGQRREHGDLSVDATRRR